MATNTALIVREEQRSELARTELASILESEYFRNSQRCSRLLRYLVEHVLDGCKAEDLKERVIGFELFHRGSNYDPAQDNVVRTAASDLRKRLAQYYNRFGSDKNPIFELPLGSYTVVFHWRENDTPTQPTPEVEEKNTVPDHVSDVAKAWIPQPEVEEFPPRPQDPQIAPHNRVFQRKMFLWITSIFLLLVAGLVFRVATSSSDALDRVWSPIFNSGKPVLVCIGEPDAWIPSLGSSPDTKDVFARVTNVFVGIGDAYALARISKLLGKRGIDWRLLGANDTSPQDLRAGPTILIGAFSNRWSFKVDGGTKFQFDNGSTGGIIVDRSNPNRSWGLADPAAEWKTSDNYTEDYALVSGFLSPETGEPTIVLAGITNYGTLSAADFATDPELLKQAFKQAPHDWRGRNFQFVLHVKILGNTPGPPTVVAAYFW
ncbi:MAG: hypothetical protein ACYCOX_07615 [Acidobacteriaceae bacterium]